MWISMLNTEIDHEESCQVQGLQCGLFADHEFEFGLERQSISFKCCLYWLCNIFFWNIFLHILGITIPTDFHIFQRGRSTTNQMPLTFPLIRSAKKTPWTIPFNHHFSCQPKPPFKIPLKVTNVTDVLFLGFSNMDHLLIGSTWLQARLRGSSSTCRCEVLFVDVGESHVFNGDVWFDAYKFCGENLGHL